MTHATGPKPFGKWQPIDSAPRDGRTILARQGGYYPCHLFWKDGEWKGVEYQVTHCPTHWLPPEPPAHAEQGDEK